MLEIRQENSKPTYVRNCFTLAMTNKLVVIINSLKVMKIKKILLYETKFRVPNYSCLQNPWLGAYRPQIPVLSVLCPQLNLLNPPHRTKVLGTPLSKGLVVSWLLNMQPTDCAETSTVSCQLTSCNIPKVLRPLQLSSLKTGRGVAVQLSRFSFCLGFRSRGRRAFRLAVTSFPAVPL